MLYVVNLFQFEIYTFRDLKPENILLKFDTKIEKCLELKLCDFGLSADISTNFVLSDFCGSPGFFAPEVSLKYANFIDIFIFLFVNANAILCFLR